MSQDQLEILVLVAERLKSQEIPYMVSGSMAMNQYAQPRMTRDIDIVVEASVSDLPALIELFQQISISTRMLRFLLANP